MKLIILILFISISCVSVKKQRNRAHEFFREYPEELAELCADRFPPEIIFRPGKEIIVRDTVPVPGPVIPCPEITNPVTGEKEMPMVKCPDCQNEIIYVYKTDTLEWENTARVAQFRLEAERLRSELMVSKESEEKTGRQARNRLYVIIGLIVAGIGYVLIRLKVL